MPRAVYALPNPAMEQLGLELAPRRQVFSVSELTAVVRELLEDRFSDVWVAGEISNSKLAPSGHYYFTLKDSGAQVRCVCFRLNARYLKVKPKDGLAVMARGRLGVYEARGEYQLYVEHLEPQGHGVLQLAFEQLKQKLGSEGLFEEARKRPLPLFPSRIGIVTSTKGAAIADILRILQRRFDGLHLRIYPARVQGLEAAGEITRGIAFFSESDWADVVIVGRGGGSLEDLWAFNEEQVARAIAACSVPVISAVGHQTDFTIADFVADLRAPTPSAAAELVVQRKADLIGSVERLQGRLAQAVRYRLAISGRRVVATNLDRATSLIRGQMGRRWQRADELGFALRHEATRHLQRATATLSRTQHALAGHSPQVGLARGRARLERLSEQVAPLARIRLERARTRLDALHRHLRHLSPLQILERGYAVVRTRTGAVIREAEQTAVGDLLQVRLHCGRLRVQVQDTKSADDTPDR